MGPEDHLVQFGGDPLGGDPTQLRGHLLDRGPHPRRDRETQLGHEPRRAQHSQRIVAEGHLGRRRGVQHPGAQRGQTAQRVDELADATGRVGLDPHRHRVDREVAADQVVVEALPETHLRIPGHPVVGVGAKGGDLHPVLAAGGPDGAELDAGVPHRVGPRPDDALHHFGVRTGGEIQICVRAQASQQRVADAAAHQVQLVAGGGEQRPEFAQRLVVPAQRHHGAREQRGVVLGWRIGGGGARTGLRHVR